MAGVLASATSCQPQPARLASNNRSYRSRGTPFMSALFFASKERQDDPRRIGRDLSVRAVLTGRVSQRGGRLLVQTDLISVADGSEITNTTTATCYGGTAAG